MMSRFPICGILRNEVETGKMEFRLTLVYGDSANSNRKEILPKCEFWLILPEVTAIEVRLSHASRM